MLQEFNEETLHIALETLTVVIKADAQAAAAWEHWVSPAVLQVWAAHVADPLIALDSTDVLQALAANPAALPSLQVGFSTPAWLLVLQWYPGRSSRHQQMTSAVCICWQSLVPSDLWQEILQMCCKRQLSCPACKQALSSLLCHTFEPGLNKAVQLYSPCVRLAKLPLAHQWHLVQERAVPALVDIIKAPEANSPVLVEGALDVLAALLRPATPEQAACVHAAASSHVMALTLRQDDAAILQSCSEYLRSTLWPPLPVIYGPGATLEPSLHPENLI